jgi:hypothetical protein
MKKNVKLVYCKLLNKDFTVKIFADKKKYFSNIVYESDTESNMIYESQYFETFEEAQEDAIKIIAQM